MTFYNFIPLRAMLFKAVLNWERAFWSVRGEYDQDARKSLNIIAYAAALYYDDEGTL